MPASPRRASTAPNRTSTSNRPNGHRRPNGNRKNGPQKNPGHAKNGGYQGNKNADRGRPQSRASALERALDAAAAQPLADPSPTFAKLDLPERLVSELSRSGISAPFAIQARALPDALAGRDVLGRAQTGSGKTLAFGLPLLTRLANDGRDRAPRLPRGLVLAPTRELAQQITDALAPLGRSLRLRMVAVYGGASMHRQINALAGGVDLVVATPGRLLDLIGQGACDLSEVTMSVLDEADYMADLGFLPDVTRILDSTPSGGQRMLFSATLDRGVDTLVDRYLTEPALHAVAAAAAPVHAADHRVFTVHPDDKVSVAAEIAERPGRTLIFVRTKHGADRLAKQLKGNGVHAAAIHGNRTQGQRTRALDGFSAGSPRVLIATDVAARGIHVDDVDLVVHFDPPSDHKDYLHRSGRTARAGASGTVLSLIHSQQRGEMARLHQLARVEAQVNAVHPGAEPVREIATSGEPVVVKERPKPATAKPDQNKSAAGKPARHNSAQNRRGRNGRRRSPDRGAAHTSG